MELPSTRSYLDTLCPHTAPSYSIGRTDLFQMRGRHACMSTSKIRFGLFNPRRCYILTCHPVLHKEYHQPFVMFTHVHRITNIELYSTLLQAYALWVNSELRTAIRYPSARFESKNNKMLDWKCDKTRHLYEHVVSETYPQGIKLRTV